MAALRLYVIGGGAAGFFGAITAAQTHPTATVTILEKNRTVLNKVRISGGGRCNVTHACFDNRQLVRHYPRGEKPLKSLLTQFSASDTVDWFNRQGVALKTEADGRMFPTTNTSETIIDCFLDAADQLGIDIRTSCGVESITPSADGSWQIKLLTGESLTADRVLIATGGYPQRGSYDWIPEQADELITPVPSLFTLNAPASYLLPLAGVSVPMAAVSVVGTKQEQRGPLLLTHWGFSGPAVLRLSAWAARDLAQVDYQFTLRVNWVPDQNEAQLRATVQSFRQQNGRKQIFTQNPFGLPSRLWQALATEAGIVDEQRWADLPAKPVNRLIESLTNSRFAITGKSTFKDEFVTCGGIDPATLNLQTLESRNQPGLFFAGEVLNIDGITGGFNFQNAWTTGYIAGKNLGV
ncbi:NAD(P)/FAD-dependent oxidoreductase [uncultured Spirosoma sp.]|uniref:NAD(P)/FAD-dependent oxidoreductase n=1 Tax=uncultured Spirosoma sp. TaxID=278208 RepID=UPI002589D34D|nr:NAD(P)/FAD-dependent oxidoreductase [uncultured Spirosoma sp.]